jgi:hypothetical protein
MVEIQRLWIDCISTILTAEPEFDPVDKLPSLGLFGDIVRPYLL